MPCVLGVFIMRKSEMHPSGFHCFAIFGTLPGGFGVLTAQRNQKEHTDKKAMCEIYE
jgi:hypothetical protein